MSDVGITSLIGLFKFSKPLACLSAIPVKQVNTEKAINTIFISTKYEIKTTLLIAYRVTTVIKILILLYPEPIYLLCIGI